MTVVNGMGDRLAAVANMFFGGERKTARWKPATALREAAENKQMHSPAVAGGEFFGALNVFVSELDRYNNGQSGLNKLKLVMLQDDLGGIIRGLQTERSQFSTLTQVGGIGLQRMGRVYPGYFFSDAAGSSGFVFGVNGRTSHYSREDGSTFDSFASRLTAPRVAEPVPVVR